MIAQRKVRFLLEAIDIAGISVDIRVSWLNSPMTIPHCAFYYIYFVFSPQTSAL